MILFNKQNIKPIQKYTICGNVLVCVCHKLVKTFHTREKKEAKRNAAPYFSRQSGSFHKNIIKITTLADIFSMKYNNYLQMVQ